MSHLLCDKRSLNAKNMKCSTVGPIQTSRKQIIKNDAVPEV